MLRRLRGFFAFAIYDQQEHTLFAARDHFGIKPFLYSVENGNFYFASELKALASYPLQRNISPEATTAFFQLSYIPHEQAIFKNVKRLLPGHFLKIQNQKLSIDSYYSLSDIKEAPMSFDQAKEKLKSLANKAMDEWIITDAPLGAFLSGGVDSSIVVALASQRIKDLKTFSVTFPESPFHNEGPYAKAVAQRYGTNHTEIPLTMENIYASVEKVLDYLDEPFADSSSIPTFALCEKVSKSIRVSLSGDGADEVFGGYEKHKAEALAQKLHPFSKPAAAILKLTENLPVSRDYAVTNHIRKANRFLDGVRLEESERYLRWCSSLPQNSVKELLKNSIYSETWQKNLSFMMKDNPQGINRTLFRDMQMVLPNDMLTKVDMMSMGNSLEVRPVFLDHSIVNHSFSLPAEYKIQGSKKKILLLETFKHLLPEAVYNRPKHGFTLELMPFFRGPFWEKLNDVYLNESFIQSQGIFNLEFIRHLKTDIRSGASKDIQALVWELVTFQNFWLKYMTGAQR